MLNEKQRNLVQSHLGLVERVISRHITPQKVPGLEYEDLYQSGCEALCRAAAAYDGYSAQFSTFAYTVIRNCLVSLCRTAKPLVSLDAPLAGCDLPLGESLTAADNTPEDICATQETADALCAAARQYTGTAQKGVYAMLLKAAGYTGREIADRYRVSPNQVSAWVSRARKCMAKDGELLLDTQFGR